MSEKSRIRWLCRRGMKELDVLLERFMIGEYDALDEPGRAAFLQLVEMEDPDLYALIMQRAEPANDLQAGLLADIREFQRPPGTRV